MEVYLRSTFLPIILLLLAGFAARAQEPQGQTKPELILEQFDVFNDGDVLLLPVALGGNKYLFALDTSATTSVYDVSLKPFLGEPAGTYLGHTPNGVVELQVFQPPPASLGKLIMQVSTPVPVADLSGLRQVSGHAIYGIIGMDFLSSRTINIDFDRGKLSFLRMVGENPGVPIHISYQGVVPGIDLDLPGLTVPVHFDIDTASVRYGGMELHLFGQLARDGKMKPAGVNRFETINGTRVARKGRLEELSIVNFMQRNLIFDEAEKTMLGLDYLSRYVVTFDFPNRTMYLKKGARFDCPHANNLSGLYVARIGGKTIVKSVDKNSPASISGIMPGDVILKIEDKKADEVRLFTIHLLCSEEKKARLTIWRDGKEQKVSLLLGQERRASPLESVR